MKSADYWLQRMDDLSVEMKDIVLEIQRDAFSEGFNHKRLEGAVDVVRGLTPLKIPLDQKAVGK